jgi:hypothetical protein
MKKLWVIIFIVSLNVSAIEGCDVRATVQDRDQTNGTFLDVKIIEKEIVTFLTYINCNDDDVYLSLDAMQAVQPITKQFYNLTNLDSEEYVFAKIKRKEVFAKKGVQILLKKGQYFTVRHDLSDYYDLKSGASYRLHYKSHAFEPKNKKPELMHIISNFVYFVAP